MVALVEMERSGLSQCLVDQQGSGFVKRLGTEVGIEGCGEGAGGVAKFGMRGEEGGGAENQHFTLRGE